MTDCKKCLFYDAQTDENYRSGQDVAIVGEEVPDDHFCLAFTPIPNGYFEGVKDCPKFLERQ